MVSNFALYHATLIVLLAVLAFVLIGLSAVSWRKRARTGSSERRIRHMLAWASVLPALLLSAVIVVVLANLGNAIHPAPGLLTFFTGGAGGL